MLNVSFRKAITLLKDLFCIDNLCLGGLKSRYIKDSQISSSSFFGNLDSHSAMHGRLDSNTGVGGWCPAEDAEGCRL